jgi:hypothetical protein
MESSCWQRIRRTWLNSAEATWWIGTPISETQSSLFCTCLLQVGSKYQFIHDTERDLRLLKLKRMICFCKYTFWRNKAIPYFGLWYNIHVMCYKSSLSCQKNQEPLAKKLIGRSHFVGYKAKGHKCSYALFVVLCSEVTADQGLPSHKILLQNEETWGNSIRA